MTARHPTPPDTERYQRLERLATGGMGEVWRARDSRLGREVAVKLLRQEYADDPAFRERFAAEARHAAALHHPHIATVFDYGLLAENHTPYLVMELVEGRPLSELVGADRPLDPDQARRLLGQAADALGAAHRAGVVHRDVKPANLLVTPDGLLKVTDFGIARATGSATITRTGEIIGTPHYLSPEQAEGKPATAASDVYALGVVLFECLTGARPFVADTPIAIALAHLHEDPPDLPERVPADLAAVTRRALAKDPAERFADGAALAAALRTPTAPVPAVAAEPERTRRLAAADLPATRLSTAPGGPSVRGTTRAPRWWARRWPLYAAGALAVLLLVGLLVARPWDEGPASSTRSAARPEMVRVDPDDYVGRPLADARADLERAGLRTRVERWANPGDRPAGAVAELDPSGRVQKGSLVTLSAWAEPPPPAPDRTEAESPPGSAGKGQDNGKKHKDKKSEKPGKHGKKGKGQDG